MKKPNTKLPNSVSGDLYWGHQFFWSLSGPDVDGTIDVKFHRDTGIRQYFGEYYYILWIRLDLTKKPFTMTEAVECLLRLANRVAENIAREG